MSTAHGGLPPGSTTSGPADGATDDAGRPEAPQTTPRGPRRRRPLVIGAAVVAALSLAAGGVIAGQAHERGRPAGSPGAGQVAPPSTTPEPTAAEPSPAETASPPPQPVGRLESVEWWNRKFHRYWADVRPREMALSRSADSWDHYSAAYSVDALTAAYQATGDTAYLDDALRMVENVMASSRPSSSLPRSQYHDAFRGWASSQEGGKEVPLYESYFWRYATSLLRVIHQTPRLADDAAVQRRYRAVLAFAQRNIVRKWVQRGASSAVYRSRTHMAAHWAMIAVNLSAVTTDPALLAQYRQIITSIDRRLPNYPSSLRRQMKPNPRDRNAYFWNDVWGSSARPGSDVSHGSGVIAYVVTAHDQGIDWTQQDIARFVELLDRVVWPRKGVVTEFVDGSGTGNGWIADGWVKLGRYDPDLQRRLEQHTVQNDQFLANGALNAALLLCPQTSGTANAPPACDRPAPTDGVSVTPTPAAPQAGLSTP